MKNKRSNGKSIFCMALVCLLVIALLPSSALAEDNSAKSYVQNVQVERAVKKPSTMKLKSVKLSQDKKKVNIKWYKGKNSTYTYVYRKVVGGPWKCIAKVKSKYTSYVDKKPIRGKSYYRVRGYYGPTKKFGGYSPSKMINIKHTHKYSSWVVKKKATCIEEGYKTRKCKYCDYSQKMTIKSLGHNMQAQQLVTGVYVCNMCKGEFVSADDVANHIFSVCGGGYSVKNVYDENPKAYHCSRCGLTEPGPKLEHKFSDWYLVMNPTCTRDGERARFCYRCQKKESVILPKLESQHQFELVATNPELGYAIYKCKYCEETEFRYLSVKLDVNINTSDEK